MQSLKIGPDGGLGPHALDGKTPNGYSAIGESARRRPAGIGLIVWNDQNHRARDLKFESNAGIGLAEAQRSALRKGAQGVAHLERDAMDIVEGENPMFISQAQHFAILVGQAASESG